MKNDKEDSILSLLPFKDYSKGFNWLIPVIIIIIMVVGLYIATKDFYFFNLPNYNIIENSINTN